MHSYPHHIGDWHTATLHLTRLERSVYREALDLYYDTEGPLEADFDRLARRLRCQDDAERTALQFVLQEFFDIEADGRWVHHRCDREIAAYRVGMEKAGVVKDAVNKRQHNHRQARARLASEMREKGVAFAWNIKTADLRALHAQHCNGDDLSRTCHALVTANHSPLSTSHFPEIPPNPPDGGAVTTEAKQDFTVSQGKADAPAALANEQPTGQQVQAVVQRLMSNFPENRQVRTPDVVAAVAGLLRDGVVSSDVLERAARAQRSKLQAEGGRSCPGVIRWLRERRWMDSAGVAAGVTAAAPSDVSDAVTSRVTGGVTGVTGFAEPYRANWLASAEGITAMGQQLGLGEWDRSVHKFFSEYTDAVRKEYARRVKAGEVVGVVA